MRITVLSTFDVWPPRDGGQTRYINIWRNFSREHKITIIAYEFRNLLAERRYKIDDHVEVIVPVASESDARHFQFMMDRTGLWLHDILCLSDYEFSSSFLRCLGEQIRSCDLLVASHPYLAKVAFPLAPSYVALAYESHNVELDIKADYLHRCSDKSLASALIAEVKDGEGYAIRQADVVSAVSRGDLNRFAQLYDLNADAAIVVPNGANIRQDCLLKADEQIEVRRLIKRERGLLGIFLGSGFAANVDSYKCGRQMLEAAGFRGTMLLVGSIDKAQRDDWPTVSFDEVWLGFVDEEVRDVLLSAADFALHLMFSGAGTNLKLFDYMGAGVPIIANSFGRRGVAHSGWCLEAEDAQELAVVLACLSEARPAALAVAKIAREIAFSEFDWGGIAKRFECAVLSKMPWLIKS
ncbi:glycosyltransferase [Methylorubrum aminovorans]